MSLPDLFHAYLRIGLYLRGWSPKTAGIYQRAFTSFQKSHGELGKLAHKRHSHQDSSRSLDYSKAGSQVIKMGHRGLFE